MDQRNATLVCFLVAVLIAISESSNLYYGGYFGGRTRNVPRLRLTGPNVCGRAGAQYCCPGWILSSISGRCNRPVCKSGCGKEGICMRPNLCLCKGNKALGISTRLAASCQITKPRGLLQQDGMPKQCGCVNGGTCTKEASCRCAVGFTGRNCGQPICTGGCRNEGRCISPNTCACQFGFSGKQCATAVLRIAPCFTKVDGNQCYGALTGIKCTRSLCCATLGYGWGVPCERCPLTPHPCRRGFIYVAKEDNCQDVDECAAIAGLCVGGICVNTVGSYKCECQAGRVRNPATDTCESISTCSSSPNACGSNGVCIDGPKGFYCHCKQGYKSAPDRKSCHAVASNTDLDYCFSAVFSGRCSKPMRRQHTLVSCCCLNQGVGWGKRSGLGCQSCPSEQSAGYTALCAQGRVEATTTAGPSGCRDLHSNICRNGVCVDTDTAQYRCRCHPGYVLNSRNECVDDNECMQMEVCKHGQCTNTEGSFKCGCDDGYALTANNRTCTDMNECMESSMCPNGKCHNMDGAYKCLCNDGYRQSSNQQICYDINECVESRNTICSNGGCENVQGGYKCNCNRGYELSPDGSFCLDYNECQQTGMCHHGKCINMDGTYRCACSVGYRLSDDKRACIDINECQGSRSPVCIMGECINTIGSFRCSCADGLVLDSEGKSCREIRKELCYKTVLRDGRCTNPSSEVVVKSECCCTLMEGSSKMCWGLSPTVCPARGTLEYDRLCRNNIGVTSDGKDINECTMFPETCDHGLCQNLLKSGYRCLCDHGFRNPSGSETTCVDIDECSRGDKCRGGVCRNTVGTYVCSCQPGFKLNPTTQQCEDINECDGSPCVDGSCKNNLGGFECLCPSHFLKQKNATHTVCVDNRKYTCWSKFSDAGCEGSLLPHGITRDECCHTIGQAWGSPCKSCADYIHPCPTGYHQQISTQCVDINECQIYPDLCQDGECLNTLGSYMCRCSKGLVLDQGRCIDLRRQTCYLSSKNGFCSAAMSRPTRKAQCCCSVGVAWSLTCDACPAKTSAEYRSLCSGEDMPSVSKDFNECMVWPELCGPGKCKNLLGSHHCDCPQGFTLNSQGTNCTDINECQLNPLTCGQGKCRNTPGTFECDCKEGYEAHEIMKVCMDKDECAEDVMLCRGGSCRNKDGSFSCLCPEGHELMPDGKACKDIDECSTGSPVCSNGRCENFMGGYQCTCDKGFKANALHTACIDIDECENIGAKCDGGCVNTVGTYHCTCQNGYKLSPNGFDCIDIDECMDNPDVCGGGQCENEQGGYRCTCTNGLTLSPDQITCTDIDECSRNPAICGNGVCENTVGSYKCDCRPGFSKKPSDVGCTDDDECLQSDTNGCHEDARCTNIEGSYQCRCKDGYSGNGLQCRDVNECLTGNGGCDPDATCINTPGNFLCMCDDGFTGNGKECFDVDECGDDLKLCENGQCLNQQGSYRCECDMGFAATAQRKACQDINECKEFSNLCVNGVCNNIPGIFQCICNQGYTLNEMRSNCTDIDECSSTDSCKFGECINIPGSYKCNCPPGYDFVTSGSACVDRRQGSCYMNGPASGQAFCTASYPQRVTRADCCCSIGAGWGQNPGVCEACPKNDTDRYKELCPGGGGIVPTEKTDGRVTLVDLDECELLPALCRGGTCQNTYGSFQCTCPTGYVIDDTYICTDVNECVLYPNICGIGTCINTQGNYTCICPTGHLLMPDKNCMDMRKSTCFSQLHNTSTLSSSVACNASLSMSLTRKLCCCTVGKGWLDPGKAGVDGARPDACDACPTKGMDDYKALCGMRPGYVFDTEINECLVIPNLCLNGQCINTKGSYTCRCNQGYVYNAKLLYCVDINECSSSNPCHETALCNNHPGSYKCVCPSGFVINFTDSSCSDINECQDRTVCTHGSCTNTVGGFVCQCNAGFTSSVNRRKCLDMNECDLQRDMCGNGTCTNMMGSYKCDCDTGFEPSPKGRCQDINECRTLRGICSYGRCKNIYGGFTCECQKGYRLSEDGHNCRDVDECAELTNACAGGDCINFQGDYKCVCPAGYKVSRDSSFCVDVDECSEVKSVCLFGRCVNERGSYYCKCPPGFVQSFDGKKYKCMDTRYGQCFDKMGGGKCVGQMPVNISRSACCCAAGSPAAWSYNRQCEACPSRNSSQFEDLCHMGPGYMEKPDGSIIDINECLMHPDVCIHGQCINMDGGFRCECSKGYHLEGRLTSYCADKDECTSPNACGRGRCSNTIGGFLCSCDDGFDVGLDGTCQDTNECQDFELHRCAFRCHNMVGSYACTCPAGYQLASDNRHCTDVDECLTPANKCRHACKNLIGTFICICPKGFRKVSDSRDECADIDECEKDSKICQHGRCINIDGGYRCECFSGYTPSATGLSCTDTRKGVCYHRIDENGFCPRNNSGLRTATMPFCCCSRALAWGQSCTKCPAIGTAQHKRLCPFGPGFDVTGQDINECLFMAGACPNGRCLNTMGSYRCACNDGYKVIKSGKGCIDLDECSLNQNMCEYKCVNTLGSFECACAAGYSLSYDKRSCHEVNECTLGTYKCPTNATCVNNRGGYTCQCPEGYRVRHLECVDINECISTDTCGTARCHNTVGGYRCSCQRAGSTFNPKTKQCEGGKDGGNSGQNGKDRGSGERGSGQRNSCKDADCMFSCEQFGSASYCGCPLGYQLVDKGHCIATISPPSEEYFKGRLPLPHVPHKQGNRLPVGEGCWLCGISNVERAGLVDAVTASLRSRYRRKRSADPPATEDINVEKLLKKPIEIVVNASMTKVRSRNNILTLLESHRHTSNETYKLFGDDNQKFRLNHLDNKVTLNFNHRVSKRRTYILVLMISNMSLSDNLLILPIKVNVLP